MVSGKVYRASKGLPSTVTSLSGKDNIVKGHRSNTERDFGFVFFGPTARPAGILVLPGLTSAPAVEARSLNRCTSRMSLTWFKLKIMNEKTTLLW